MRRLLTMLCLVGCGGATPSGSTGRGGQGGVGTVGGQCPTVNVGTRGGDPNAAATWSRPFTLSHWLGPDMWTGLASTVAIDGAERVYITDAKSIFVADASGARVLYSSSQLAQDIGTPDYFVSKMDVSPDGRLFALIDLSNAEFTTALYAADGQGHLRRFADFKTFWPNMPVISAVSSDFVLAPFDSLYCVTSNLVAPLYGPIDSPTPVVTSWSTYGCSGRSITTDPGGFFFYSPGCGGSPVVGGRTDGSGVSELWKASDSGEATSLFFWDVARAPRGGGIVNLGTTFSYVDETNQRIRLDISPASDFVLCRHVVGASDTIYVVCLGDIYRAIPQP